MKRGCKVETGISPQELQTIVDEVVRRVRAAVEGGGAAGAAAGSAGAGFAPAAGRHPEGSDKPSTACSLAHGVAARPPATIERAEASASAAGAAASPSASAAAGAQPGSLVEAGACRVGSCHAGDSPASDLDACARLAPYLDHTLLKPTATDSQVRRLCEEARKHRFATVCVNSAHVPLCVSILAGTGVGVCSVVGFPLGAMSTESKAFETRKAVADGATEIDMVIHVGKLQQGDYGYVLRDIEAVVGAAHGTHVKVIIEAALLTDEQKIIACALSKAAGAHFVKTSTGFGPGGATVADVALMRRVVGAEMGVKAAGGIRDCAIAREMIEAGANRLGASASVEIIAGAKAKGNY